MNLHGKIMNIRCDPGNASTDNTRIAYADGHRDARQAASELVLVADAEIERLRADRDCEKRLRKDSDDLATDLRLALQAVIDRPSDTGLAHDVLQRIHGCATEVTAAAFATFQIGDLVAKTRGAQWRGRVVGRYSTELTPEGYAVESSTEFGSVQIYPAAALELVSAAA